MENQPSKKKRQKISETALGRVGETNTNSLGSLMIVEQYNGSQNVLVRFVDQENTVKTTWHQFVTGRVKNVNDKSKFAIGYIGEGDHPVRVDGRYTTKYLTWSAMLMRCYSKQFQKDHPTYKDVSVCKKWHSYQNFASWFDANYYEIDGHKMHLDKDILKKGNRVYSPETCAFVPQFINGMFASRKALRGNTPIGVKVCSRYGDKYEVRCCNNKGGRVYLGRFDSPEKAFEVYKIYKEKLIKDVADEFKHQIPEPLYDALYKYKVDFTD
ncbi:hypothetical protein [Bacillus sp. 2205SS5-2]|uniref:hypothetical protein n=1 Tax=Bacillus sp. 2205SS5-2 TaxID=3109031 RepID=UPI003007D915